MTVERPAGDLGKKLREARERKGVSLREIANSTKIAIAVLDALERNDIAKLPGGIFGRAFVRSFATEVGLDPEATIKEFMAQFREDSVAIGHPPSDRVEDHAVLKRKRRSARTFFGAIAVGIPVAAVVVYIAFARRHEPAAFATPQPLPAIADAAAAPLVTAGVPALERPSEPVPSTVATTPAAAEPAVVGNASFTDRMVITLAVKRACWVAATVDGKRQIARVLRPGDARSLDIRKELTLSVGDAGAVTMTINGIKARPLGRSGEVLTTRLSLANAKRYLPAR